MTDLDHLGADRLSAPGGQPVLIVDAASWRKPAAPIQAVVIGVDPDGVLPVIVDDDFDLLVTSALAPPWPWVSDTLPDRLADAVATSPYAMSAPMRDALYEALANALDDPSRPEVVLKGAGKCFSTGGALAEFGMARDLAEAHSVRTLHNCARALDALAERATVRLHGACVGSGIEVAAAAHRRVAAPDAWFQLPELTMGLIPGAGGTATVARAIGRHRTLWMLLSAKRVRAALALEWGLIDAIEDGP